MIDISLPEDHRYPAEQVVPPPQLARPALAGSHVVHGFHLCVFLVTVRSGTVYGKSADHGTFLEIVPQVTVTACHSYDKT